jgi:sec-independent protein translocase protein TatA
MFGLGVPELIIILVLVLLVLGPGKLPELGSFLGKSLREFRDSLEHRNDETPPPETGAPVKRPESTAQEDRD